MEDLSQIPTPTLIVKLKAEQERVLEFLIRMYPISQTSLELFIADLKAMDDELKRRKEKTT